MHIALIHMQLVRKGGMERYLLDLIKGFTQAGHRITVITSKVDPDLAVDLQCQTVICDLARIPKGLRNYYLAKRVKVQLEHMSVDISLSLTRSWGQQVTVCGGTHEGYLSNAGKWRTPLARLEIHTERHAYRTSNIVIAHSVMLRDELVNFYGIPTDKIVVVHPPADTDRFNQSFRPQRTELRRKYGLAENKLCLFFPSTGHRRKGLPLLLRAMKLLPTDGFELIVAGSRPSAGSSALKYVGFVDEIEELFTAVDFTVLPSYYEPFGLVVSESLLCGTPVLVSGNVGARDIMTERDGVVFEEQTPEVVAAGILEASTRQFMIDPDLARSRGLMLRDHIERLAGLFIKAGLTGQVRNGE